MRRALATLLLAASGCGDDAPSDRDSGDASPMRVEPASPIASASPALPDFEPCPEGWTTRTTAAGVSYCDPFPGGLTRCEGATMRLPGTRECTPVGAACPAGEWPTTLPSDRTVIYVREGARAGDGTRERPFGTLLDAVDAAPANAIVALAKGDYTTPVDIARPIELVGACAAETVVTGGDRMRATIQVTAGGRLVARDLRLGNEHGNAVEIREGSAQLEGVWVGPARGGVLTLGATPPVVIEGSLFRDNYDAAATLGSGVVLINGACEIRDTAFDGASKAPIRVSEGSLTLERVAISAAVEFEQANAYAIHGGGGRVELRSVALRAANAGILLSGAEIDAEDVTIEALQRPTGLTVGASTGTLRRIAIIDVPAFAATFYEGDLRIEDLLISGTRPDPSLEDFPATMSVAFEQVLDVTRLAIEGTEVSGITISELGSLTGRDVTLLGARDADIVNGFGITTLGGRFELERVRAASWTTAAIALDEASRGTLADATLEDIGASAARSVAVGVNDGSSLVLTRATIDRAHTMGIAISRNSTLSASDVILRDVIPSASDGEYGRGIEVADGASIELDRARLERTHDYAILVGNAASATMRDVVIDGIAPRACMAGDCVEHPGGIGVGAYGGTLDLERFALRGATLCGVHFAPSATVSLRNGRVESNAIGVCVEGDAASSGLGSDLVYEGNGTNLDTVQLPVPVPLTPIEVTE